MEIAEHKKFMHDITVYKADLAKVSILVCYLCFNTKYIILCATLVMSITYNWITSHLYKSVYMWHPE